MTTGLTGVARYVTELDKALVDAGVDLQRFALGRGPYPAPANTRRVTVPLRVLHKTWRSIPRSQIDRFLGRSDVVHTTDLVPPPTRTPLVITVHDLDALDHPELHNRRARALQRAQLAAAKHRADVVLAVSATTATALQDHGVDADRITVAYLGATVLPPPDRARVPDGPYLVAVGSIDARKGLDVLVRAFARARLDGVRLVIAGPEGHQADVVRNAVAAAGATDRVLLSGRVTDAELAGLYAGALAYCLPSQAEGFGLPVLEAMAAGAPVIASDLPVVREVVGAAAVLVPVGDEEAWADTLERVIVDDDRLASLAAAGRVNAARFTWEETARTTAAVYERVVGANPGRRA